MSSQIVRYHNGYAMSEMDNSALREGCSLFSHLGVKGFGRKYNAHAFDPMLGGISNSLDDRMNWMPSVLSMSPNPSLSVAPAPTRSMTPVATLGETPVPSVGVTPMLNETPTPSLSVMPTLSETPIPSMSVTPMLNETPIPSLSVSPSLNETPIPSLSVTPTLNETPLPPLSVTPTHLTITTTAHPTEAIPSMQYVQQEQLVDAQGHLLFDSRGEPLFEDFGQAVYDEQGHLLFEADENALPEGVSVVCNRRGEVMRNEFHEPLYITSMEMDGAVVSVLCNDFGDPMYDENHNVMLLTVSKDEAMPYGVESNVGGVSGARVQNLPEGAVNPLSPRSSASSVQLFPRYDGTDSDANEGVSGAAFMQNASLYQSFAVTSTLSTIQSSVDVQAVNEPLVEQEVVEGGVYSVGESESSESLDVGSVGGDELEYMENQATGGVSVPRLQLDSLDLASSCEENHVFGGCSTPAQ